MDEEWLAQQKERLQRELEQTQVSLKRIRESLRSEAEFDIEEAAPDLYEREKALALLGTLERKAESIERALQAMEKGSYGLCEQCGGQIEPARLRILPETTICVKCKAALERLAGR